MTQQDTTGPFKNYFFQKCILYSNTQWHPPAPGLLSYTNCSTVFVGLAFLTFQCTPTIEGVTTLYRLRQQLPSKQPKIKVARGNVSITVESRNQEEGRTFTSKCHTSSCAQALCNKRGQLEDKKIDAVTKVIVRLLYIYMVPSNSRVYFQRSSGHRIHGHKLMELFLFLTLHPHNFRRLVRMKQLWPLNPYSRSDQNASN